MFFFWMRARALSSLKVHSSGGKEPSYCRDYISPHDPSEQFHCPKSPHLNLMMAGSGATRGGFSSLECGLPHILLKACFGGFQELM